MFARKRQRTTIQGFHKLVKAAFRDLQSQALSFDYAEPTLLDRGSFVMNLAADLDPFSASNKCAHPRCRLHTANQIGKFMGLYADTAYLPDSVGSAFAFTEKWTIDDSRWLLLQFNLLFELAPLVSAGVLKFTIPAIPTCQSCKNALDERVSEAAAHVIANHREKLIVERNGNLLAVDTRDFDTGIVWRHPLTPEEIAEIDADPRDGLQNIAHRMMNRLLSEHVREVLLSTYSTIKMNASTFTTSRASLLALRQLERSLPEIGDVAGWEAPRVASLPWVGQMSIPEIMQLRQEAATALPRFRARVGAAMQQKTATREEQVRELVAELREDAVEVEQEFRSLHLQHGERFRNVFGGLSIAIAAFACASEFAPAAVAGLMTALGLVHTSARKDHQEVEELKSRPGFVLLKARSMLGHREG
jgi:hypothetical protein